MSVQLKSALLVFLCLKLNYQVFSQVPGEWTWMSGNLNSTTVYGTQGVPSPSNTPGNLPGNPVWPAAWTACWTDLDGNFWFFNHNQEMWKYDVGINSWAWMHGGGNGNSMGAPVFGPPNVFGPNVLPTEPNELFTHYTWVDLNGDLWYTGPSSDYYSSSSTWKFSISLNQWAFVQGNIPPDPGVQGVPSPTNNPCLRFCSSHVQWVGDDGKLWAFFGGSLCGASNNGMWNFDPNTSMWTHVSSGNLPLYPLTGIVGVYDPLNTPSEGSYVQSWKSDDGTFYMFGNVGDNNPLAIPGHNIMWQYNPNINQWRVVHLGDSLNSASFSNLLDFNPSNHPSAVPNQRSAWKDDCNRFYGRDAANGSYIWCFNPAINEYAIIEGNVTTASIPINYGTQGISDPNVTPGTTNGMSNMEGGPFWTDMDGNFWEILGDIDYPLLYRYVPVTINSNLSSFTSNLTEGCAPLTVDFNSINTASSFYHWDFGDLTVLSDTSNLAQTSYTFNTPGTYNVQLIIKNCLDELDTSNLIITVVSPPILNISEDTTICQNSTINLFAYGADSIYWSPNSFLNSNSTNIIQTSPSSSTEYIVTGTTNSCSVTDTIQVSIFPVPILNAGNDTSICIGDSIFLNAISSITPIYWSDSLNNGHFTYPIANTIYIASVTDTVYCNYYDSIVITVNPLPIVDAGVDSTICEGSSFIFQNNGNALNYSWSNNIIPNTPIIIDSTITIQVNGTSAFGCINSDSITITIQPKPVLNFEVLDSLGCLPFNASFICTTPGWNSLIWNFGDGSTTSNEDTVSHLYSTPSCYDINLEAIYQSCTVSKLITNAICIQDIPEANFIFQPNSITEISNNINFINTSVGAINYYWDFGNNQNSNLFSPNVSFDYEFDKDYIVTLVATSSAGCSDTSIQIIPCAEEIVFYIPNTFTPDGDEFNNFFVTYFSSGFDPYDFVFKIYNRWGEIIFESRNHNVFWDGTFQGHLVEDGVYTWEVEFSSINNANRFNTHGHVNVLR